MNFLDFFNSKVEKQVILNNKYNKISMLRGSDPMPSMPSKKFPRLMLILPTMSINTLNYPGRIKKTHFFACTPLKKWLLGRNVIQQDPS